MDNTTAHILNYTTQTFYQIHSDEFSDTRKSSWDGWDRAFETIVLSSDSSIKVIDFGCGNLRFERYLGEKFPLNDFDIHAIDCSGSLPNVDWLKGFEQLQVQIENRDIIGDVLSNEFLLAHKADLSVAFGFMHHIPGSENRITFLREILSVLNVGGFCIVSFWQYNNNDQLKCKAERFTALALDDLAIEPMFLDKGDGFFGWNEPDGIYRYCHHFSNEEINQLIEEVKDIAHTVDIFNADGRTGDLNRYVVFKRI